MNAILIIKLCIVFIRGYTVSSSLIVSTKTTLPTDNIARLFQNTHILARGWS